MYVCQRRIEIHTGNSHDDDRLVRSPVVRVAMSDAFELPESTDLLEQPHDRFTTTGQDFLPDEVHRSLRSHNVHDAVSEAPSYIYMAQ